MLSTKPACVRYWIVRYSECPVSSTDDPTIKRSSRYVQTLMLRALRAITTGRRILVNTLGMDDSPNGSITYWRLSGYIHI